MAKIASTSKRRVKPERPASDSLRSMTTSKDMSSPELGTLKATLYAMCFAVPLSLFSAMYVSHFTSPAFRRAIKPLVTHFGKEPEKLLKTAEIFGGYRADYGDAAVTIDAFKHVAVTMVLWRGDDEFAPEGSIMFDSTVSDYLSNDDIHALCENIAWKLVRMLKS